MKNNRKTKIQEKITNLNTLGFIPADEVQLNIDVLYDSVLPEICSIVSMDSPRQIISGLKLNYGSEQKAQFSDDGTDVVNRTYMKTVGAMPLDDDGYPTNVVRFTVTTSSFIGNYKKILPGTIVITANDIKYTDDGNGNIIDNSKTTVGTVQYEEAIFDLTGITAESYFVVYDFDLYNILTSRNLAQFEKRNVEVFADMYQLDVDSAIALNDFKGVNLKKNIENILPQVLSQQIDQNVLMKYFNQLDLTSTHVETFDADTSSSTNVDPTKTFLYRDFASTVSVEMGRFAVRTGVVPNIILCDPLSYSMLSMCPNFETVEEVNNKVSGMPKKVGYFGVAKVFLVQVTNNDSIGKLVITYKGDSDAQAAGIYSPFIPVTLRTVNGAEGGGMVVTNNIYSIAGFTLMNPELVSGIKVTNII